MRIPKEWLAEYVDLPDSTETLARQLTQLGLEVEEIYRPDRKLNGLRIVAIRSTSPHPHRDDLTVCEISDEDNTHQVVSAANPNTKKHYVWAPPGAMLQNETIDDRNFAGTTSEGMLCSLEELGLTASSSSLLGLSASIETGVSAVDALALDSPILELDLTPNRSDCLSLLGVARDYATSKGLDVTTPEIPELTTVDTTSRSVSIEDPSRCEKYIAIEMDNLSVESTPKNIQRRLVLMGLEPRNRIVDVTNYVLYELGNPLHAFDAETLDGPISVRLSRAEESLETIDGTEIDLHDNDLIITDQSKPLALAGIMGGNESAVEQSTRSILLEGAYFTPGGIRDTSGNHKLHTESSHRFERGVDPNGVFDALKRCVDLIIGDDDTNVSVNEPTIVEKESTERPAIPFASTDFEELIGYDLDQGSIEETFDRLGCNVENGSDQLTITPPSWRHDLQRKEDLVEELIRLDGYESVGSEFPSFPIHESPDTETDVENICRLSLSNLGFKETVTFSFHSDERDEFTSDGDFSRVSNPLSEEQAVLRKTLLDNMLPIIESNLEAGETNLKLFEIGTVFQSDESHPRCLGLLVTGSLSGEHWDDYERPIDFYDLKGIIECLMQRLGYSTVDFVPDIHSGFASNRSASVTIDETVIGSIGQVIPDLLDVDHDEPCWGAELELSTLPEPEQTSYDPYSKEPYVKRDLDLVVDRNQYVRDLKQSIRKSARWLEKLEIFDLYRGEPLPSDKKSISFRLFFRASDRTLEDDEVNETQENILDTLRAKYGAYLRDE